MLGRGLLVAALVSATIVAPMPAAAAGATCPQILIDAGKCSSLDTRNTGEGVTLAGERAGSREVVPSVGVDRGSHFGSWSPAPGPFAPPPPPPDESDFPITCLDPSGGVLGGDCATFAPDPEPAPDEPEEPQIPAVITLADIASFVPTPPSVSTEPDGIAAKNMPMNSIAGSEAHTVAGDLFGLPVAVTFTPAGFRQDWGDGTVTESGTGGASWSALGQAEYTPTATSHAYAQKGTYALTITALYTAVVDFGPYGTRPVDGIVSAPGASREIRVVEVHTALVQNDCTENPAAAGCPA